MGAYTTKARRNEAMIIDKITPYLTEEEQQQLADLRREEDSKLKVARGLSGKDRQAAFEELDDIIFEIGKLEATAERRYQEQNSKEKVLEDIKDIVSAFERADFLAYLKEARKELDLLKTSGAKGYIYETAKKAAKENYDNCFSFIYFNLVPYINALGWTEETEEKVFSIMSQQVELWYPNTQLLVTLPQSPASNLVLEALGAGINISDLPDRKKQVNHGTKYEVQEDGSKRLLSVRNAKVEVEVEISDIERLIGGNKPAKKFFVLSLVKAREQAIHNGQLTKEYICFPLQELVDIGFYKTLRSARAGFNSGREILTDIKIRGKVKKTSKKVAEVDALEVLFTGARIEKGQCFIFLNTRINWSFLVQYYTKLPRYYFKLPNRASDLLYYIFYMARQNTKDIAEKGYFTISFRAIQHRLMLPGEKGLNNPQRDIKEAIETAIEQIEDEHNIAFGNTDFALLPVYDDNAPIAEYLDNGYLKVALKGDFASTFIAISEDKEKKIEQAKKRQEKIQEKAMIQATAKKLDPIIQAGIETLGNESNKPQAD